MNIVFVSNLSGKKSAGLSYSIPAQVENQRKFDNVFWYNINNVNKNNLINGNSCFNKYDYPKLRIGQLPSPFNEPDLVVFEGVYNYEYIAMSKECKNKDIPYIVIPRSSLTENAQKKKAIKKITANLVFFKSFIKGAMAIQYLTLKEYEDSGDKWNKKYLIIPNGIEPKEKAKKFNSRNEGITGIFIGRADSFQKGLDLLLDACVIVKDDILKNQCKINIFAPNSSEDTDDIQEMILKRNLGDIFTKYDGIYGEDKEKEILSSDFFILTSRFEGHPMGLIEALSYGIPCIVTEGSNMGEEIEKYNAGWASETTKEGIAESFRELFLNKVNLDELGKNALQLSKMYSWDRIAKLSSEEYKNLIESRVLK